MVAGALLPAHMPVDAGHGESSSRPGAEEEMVEAQPMVARPAIELVVPERVHGLVGMGLTHRINPSLVEKAAEGGAAFRLEESVLVPGPRRIDVLRRRHDIEV